MAKSKRRWALGATAALMSSLTPVAAIAQEATYQFNIPAQSLGAALRAFGQQSGQQIIFDGQRVQGLQSTALVGGYSADEGLLRLLDGTNLTFERTQAGVLVVQERNSPTRTGATISPPTDEGEEITVTGTRIRGRSAAGAQTIVITREEIEDSGFATAADALRLVPQQAPAPHGLGDGVGGRGSGNFGSGTGLDLRGLGLGTTLVLVNGHRQAGAGSENAFVDISSIPTAAIDRVEILLDGASAVYGSDAIGGVVNIILRSDYSGSDTAVRIGSLDGDAGEHQFSHVFGRSWEGGHFFAGMEFNGREALNAAARAYASSCDQTSRGGDNFCIPFANPANILDPNTFEVGYAVPAGQDGTSLSVSDLLAGVTNFENSNVLTPLVSPEETWSLFGSLDQRVTQNFQLHGDLRITRRTNEAPFGSAPNFLEVPSTNPFYVNPYPGQAFCSGSAPDCVFLFYDMSRDIDLHFTGENWIYNGNINGTLDLANQWSLTANLSVSKQKGEFESTTFDSAALEAALADPNPATAFNPFGDGSNTNPTTLAAITVVRSSSTSSQTQGAGLIAEGPLFQGPAGPIRAALGATLDAQAFEYVDAEGFTDGNLKRSVGSAFAELSIPAFGDVDARDETSLLLSLALRYDEYDDVGSTVNPKIGARLRLNSSLALRGTWGTSFRAPDLTQLAARSNPLRYSQATYSDPASSSGFSSVLLISGVSPDLGPENAETWSFGVDFTPSRSLLPRVSLTYTDITYEDRVAVPGPPFAANQILLQEDVWSSVIQRNPTPSEVSAICTSPSFFGLVSTCLSVPKAAIIDLRTTNIAYLRAQSIDFRVDKSFELADGVLSMQLDGAYNFGNERALTERSPRVDIVDTLSNPLSLRMRGVITYTLNDWEVGVAANYSNAYVDLASGLTGDRRDIDSLTTYDFRVEYEPGAGWLNGASIALNVVNAFNTDPPYVNTQFGYDFGNFDPYGRIVSLQLRRAW